MKIPRYEQQVSPPNAPQFSAIPDLRSDNLSAVADTLKGVYEDKLREQEEAKKTAIFQADTSIKMAMTKAMFDLQDRIKNGGSYANAEAEYQKAHDEAIKQFGSAFDVDETGNTKARALSEYQADGLNNILKIRELASARRKSDAASSANNRLDLLKREYVMAGDDHVKKEAALKAMSGTVAGLSAAGVINGDEGKQKLRMAIGGAEADRLSIVAQNNAHNPQLVLDEIEKSKDILDVDTYISMRGAAMADLEKVTVTKNALNLLNENPQQMKQEDVDNAFSVIIEMGVDSSSPQYSSEIIRIASLTGKIPTQLDNQMSSIISMPAESITDVDASTFVQFAQTTKSMPISAVSKMSGFTQAAVNFVNDSVDAGIPEQVSVKQVSQALSSMRDPSKAEGEIEKFRTAIYKDGKDYLADKVNGTMIGRLFETNGASLLPGEQGYKPSPDMRKFFETRAFIYDKIGASDPQKKAYEDVSKIYQPFDGKVMKYSPRVVTGLDDDNFKKIAIVNPLKKTSKYNENYEYKIQSDAQTELEFMEGKKVTYPIYYENEMGVLDRVRDDNNVGLRTMPLKVSGYKPVLSIGPLTLTDEARQKYKRGELKPWLQK